MRGWRTTRFGQALAVALIVPVLVPVLGGCSASSEPARPGVIDVAASTSAWGSVAQAVGGRWVDVTSIIDSPNQDPHSFNASARTLLIVKRADLVIENGGGYDDFMRSLIASSHSTAPVVNAVQVSGHVAPPGGELNEHVWYDLRAGDTMADRLAAEFEKLEPRHAEDFTANAARFRRSVSKLMASERAVRAGFAGTGVAITEPVPLYMLDAMGLDNLTPPEFSESIEESGDVSPRSLAEVLALFDDRKVAALVYNSQTTGPVTMQVRETAVTAGVPVVPVTETLPPGDTYLTWMASNIDRIRRALGAR